MSKNFKLEADLALAQTLGRKDFAQAIQLLRVRPFLDASNLAFISQCHCWLDEEPAAIVASHQALQSDANCFDAHRILASIYAHRREHALGVLHTKHAIRTRQTTAKLPHWLEWLLSFSVLLRRGRAAASAAHARNTSNQVYEEKWLQWARDYVVWNGQRGTLVAANQDFPSAPRAEP